MHISTNSRTWLAAASIAACVITLALSVVPAQAASPVSPPEHDVFVISPDDGGACPFPVQWDVTSRNLSFDTPHHFFAVSPAWSIASITNLDNGKTLTPHGNGSFKFTDLPDGSTLQTGDGVNYAPFFGLRLVGHVSRTISPDGDLSDFTGPGQVIDLCAMLS